MHEIECKLMDTDEIIVPVSYTQVFKQDGTETHLLASSASERVSKRLQKILDKLAAQNRIGTFPGYCILVNSDTETIVSVCTKATKEKWAQILKKDLPGLVAPTQGKKEFVLSNSGNVKATEDKLYKCCSTMFDAGDFDGILLYERYEGVLCEFTERLYVTLTPSCASRQTQPEGRFETFGWTF